MKDKIICGDALTVLKTLPDELVDCIVTSPPYYALRDYKIDGQIGLEPTYQEFIFNLCNIFDEVKRVLKKDGTCFVNLGDTYASVGKVSGDFQGDTGMVNDDTRTLCDRNDRAWLDFKK